MPSVTRSLTIVGALLARKAINAGTIGRATTAARGVGRSMKEAAFILKLSPRTVAFHKYAMMEHLRIKSSAELVQYALNSPLLAA